MKKSIIILAAMAAAAFGVEAKTVDQLRIYINPGHGSYTGNDRPMNTIRDVDGTLTVINPNTEDNNNTPDTTAFYESNTNLQKGFGMLEELAAMGFKFERKSAAQQPNGAARDLTNNLVMSRVKSGPYPCNNGSSTAYNRDLTEIASEVESNNFDLFWSIHSDATETTSTNRPLALYRGHKTPKAETGCALSHQQTSREIMLAVWPHVISQAQHKFSGTSASSYVTGDLDFYSKGFTTNSMGYYGYLGVLKHGTVGGLIEGYCHTYMPDRHRALNWEVDQVEGVNYARGVAEYLNVARTGKGLIYGVVRYKGQTFSHTYYSPRSGTNDEYKPVNGATVTLRRGGQVLATKTTDNNYNGAFVFLNLDPGRYTIVVEKQGYDTFTQTYYVKADTDTYPEIFIANDGSSMGLGEAEVDYGTYPDPAQDAGFEAKSNYALEQDYVDKLATELDGYTVKRMIPDGDYLYILGHNASGAPKLVVYNHQDGEVTRTLGVSDCTGSYKSLSDIALTGDKLLVGINETAQAYGGANNVHIYRWAKDENGVAYGEATEWFSTNLGGNWGTGHTGETMTYLGSTADGHIVYSAQSDSGTSMRTVNLTISGGERTASAFTETIPNFSKPDLGDFLIFPSPFGDDRYIVNGTNKTANELGLVTTRVVPTIHSTLNDGVPASVAHTGMFRHGGKIYMTAPVNNDGVNTGVRLLDITDGLANAQTVVTTNTTLSSAAASNVLTAGTTTLDMSQARSVRDARLVLFEIRESNGVSKFSEPKTPEPFEPELPSTETILTPYAYDISAECIDEAAGDYIVRFKTTGDADATVVLHSPTATQVPRRREIGPVKKGQVEAQIHVNIFTRGEYFWDIELVGQSNGVAGEYFSDSNGLEVRGGAVPITDPTQAQFGYIVVSHGGNNGFDVYDPVLNKVESRVFKDSPLLAQNGNVSSAFRGDELEGSAVFADYSDGGAGYWIVDPLNVSMLGNMIEGTRDSKGAYTNNGKIIGGGSSCVGFQGQGTNDLKVFSFVEDYPTANQTTGMKMYRYDLGSSRKIMEEPNFTYNNISGTSLMINRQVDVAVADNGFFASQARGAGNNTETIPSFIYCTNDGNILLNSATDAVASAALDKGSDSSIALNRTRDLLAVGSYNNGGIKVFGVTWSGDTPHLTFIEEIPTSKTSSWSTLKFDYANNLHAFERDNYGYHVYNMSTVSPVTLTPAPANLKLVSTNTGTGVENVAVDPAVDAEPEVTYYTLQGVRVAADNLQRGVYVKVVGNKATKVLVK